MGKSRTIVLTSILQIAKSIKIESNFSLFDKFRKITPKKKIILKKKDWSITPHV